MRLFIKKNPSFIFLCLLTLVISLPISGQSVSSPDDLFLEGVKEFNVNNIAGAESLFLKTLKANPGNDAACYYLGIIYHTLGKIDDSEKYLKKASDMDATNIWYRIKLAQFYADTDRIEVALTLYEKLSKDYPDNSSLYYQIIELYTSDGQIDKALETLDRIESLGGVTEATGNARYELLNMKGLTEEAYSYLEEFEKDYPSPRTAYLLGDIYKSRFNDTTAVNYYNKALSMDPSYAPAYFGLAEVYRMTRRFGDYFENINIFLANPMMSPMMKAEYLKEVVLNPQFVQTFKPQIDTMMLSVLTAHPQDSTSLYLVGTYYIQTERAEEGAELFLKNLNNYPRSHSANIEYLSLLYYQQEWDKLITQMQSTLAIFPEDPALLEILAVAHWQNGNIDEGIRGYLHLLRILPKESEMLLNCYSALGDLYHLKGNNKKAYSNYQKALKINPTYNPVLNNFAYYLSLEGKKLSKALEMSKKTVTSEPDNPTYLDTYGWLLYQTGDAEDAKGYFKHAMLYGGKENAVILDHYADVLFALKEYDLAIIYWEQADKLDPTLGITEKIAAKKKEIKK